MLNMKLLQRVALFFLAPLISFAQTPVGVEPLVLLDDNTISGEVQNNELESFVKDNPNMEPIISGGQVFPPLVDENIVGCFDYYTFGSIQADINPGVSSSIVGVTQTFSGTIRNDNPYPIVDGSLYVKVFRKQQNDVLTQKNGGNLVDQFVAKEAISLAGGASEDISFDWAVPAYALSGEYQFATFFISAGAYNLSGLSFTDDILGNTSYLSIKGDVTKGVSFNKNTVLVNDESYVFAAATPKVTTQSVDITAVLVNDTKTAQIVPLTWTVYSWDAMRERNVISEIIENVVVEPESSVDVLHTVYDTQHTVYLVVADALYQDTHSILDVRFVRSGMTKPRINFPSILSYPLVAGVENTLFACLHDSGTVGMAEDSKFHLLVKGVGGEVITEREYYGQVSGSMMGLAYLFTPQESVSDFTIEATLYHHNIEVDSNILTYHCEDIDPASCVGMKKTTIIDDVLSTPEELSEEPVGLPIIIGSIVGVGSMSVLLWLRKRKSVVVTNNEN